MADLDAENAELEARIAQLEAMVSQQSAPPPTALDLSTPERQAVAAGAGGLLNMVDVPTMGLVSRALAAPKAIYQDIAGYFSGEEPKDYFTPAYQPYKELIDTYKASRDAAGLGETEEALQFMIPLPGKKLDAALDLTKAANIAAAKEAGLGLAAYGGQELGGWATGDSTAGRLIGALGAPMTLAAAPAAIKYGPEIGGRLMSSLKGSDEVLQEAVNKEIMSRLSDEELSRLVIAQQAPELLTSASGAKKTLAEITQSAPAAKYQQLILENQGGGGELAKALEARIEAPQKALSEMGVMPEQGEFATKLREAATDAAAAKAAKETEILTSLGLPERADLKPTNMEMGEYVQRGLIDRAEEDYLPVKEIWDNVNKSTQMDVAPQLMDAVNEFKQFDRLTKGRISPIAQATIDAAKKALYRKDGLITVKDYQGIRASANAALKNATNVTDQAEISLMNRLKNNLDNIDESAIIKGGDGEQVAKLTDAIKATRDYYSVYGRGVVKDIIKKRGGELSIKASQVVNRALKYPENVAEIIGKFGKDANETMVLRYELLDRLGKEKNPTEYLARNKDLYQQAFDSDYKNLVNYAQSKGKGLTGFEEFVKASNANIPNKIFADEQAAGRFMDLFGGTEAEQFARAKFISARIAPSSKGNAIERLLENKKVAKKIFKNDYDNLEKLVADIEGAKSVDRLEVKSAKNQSVTKSRLTALGALMDERSTYSKIAKYGDITGAGGGLGLGVAAAAGKGFLTSGLLGAAVAGAGAIAGNIASKEAKKRLTRMDEIAATLISNPEMIKIAAAAPTEKNVTTLLDFLKASKTQNAFIVAKTIGTAEEKVAKEQPKQAKPPVAQQFSNSIDDENAMLEEQIRKLEERFAPQATVQVGKQNISLPVGEEYPEPSLIKAVIQVESGNKPDAVSKVGAIGLMQLMPATAKDLGLSEDEIADPEKNVEAGARYLQRLVNRYNGDIELALAAYNWGLGRVDKAISRLNSIELKPTWSNIVDNLGVPRETRDYVRKVKAAQRKLVSV